MEIFKYVNGFDYKTVILSNDGKKAFCLDCNGLVILDITDTHNTVEIGKYGIDDIAKFMTVSKDEDKAYITTDYAGLLIVDISDQSNPVILGSSEIIGNNWDIALSKCGTKAYVVNYTHSKSGRKSHLITVDISDASNPTKICKQTIPKKNAHNIVLSKNGKRAFISCGEYLEVVDIKTDEEV